jgi:hypothetical protein
MEVDAMSRTGRQLVLAVVAVTAVSLGAFAPASFGQTASLGTETLEANPIAGQETRFLPFTCDKDGNTRVEYETTGGAFGPYNGTFVETGTFTIGPQTNTDINSLGVGPISNFQASFTITSTIPPATITGTKTLSPNAPTEPSLAGGVFGRCDPDGSSNPNHVSGSMGNHVVYEAQIDAATGSRTDSGTGALLVASPAISGLEPITFHESFISDEPVPPPPGGCGDGDKDDDPGDDDDHDGDDDDDDDDDCDDDEEDGDDDGDD